MSIAVEWLGRIEYAQGLEIQTQVLEKYLAGQGPEKVLILEHEPVYTIGRTRNQESLREPAALPYPVFETNRGGQATWHGPGQLVAYPILDLQNRGKDLHAYMRFLEEIIIQTCAACGAPSGRRDGLTGVWCEDRKIASIGVGVRRWVTMHGLALNVTNETQEAFSHIIPCGIANVEMTNLEHETGQLRSVREVGEILGRELLARLGDLQPEA